VSIVCIYVSAEFDIRFYICHATVVKKST
jgi:hypothetical protein